MKVFSTAFKEGEEIPSLYTCDGDDISPPLSWEPVSGSSSYSIIMEDPDAPGGVFVHWVIFNVRGNSLPENVEKTWKSSWGIQGLNDFGRVGYGGPCPPRHHQPHRYYFRVYALSKVLPEERNVRASRLRAVISGAVINEGSLMGRYRRR
jgi:Raf kinase inhibitor-like YbhB/YbcL family protein